MDEVLLAWKKNLNEKDIITKISGDTSEVFKTTKGNTQCKVKIIAKKIANKNVTIIDGLNFFVDLKDITKTFSKHFACSVAIKPFQNSEAIFIQGYWIFELVEILQGELKLSKNFIVVEDKLNLKKKK
jgi:translation initiation factor 1 (eIF-1/SUI1)